MLVFEWDEKEAHQNVEKHGVSLGDVATVFGDPLSIKIYYPLHSKDEERFVILGMSNKSRILAVMHADRDDRIKIISARKAGKKERKQYESSEK